MNMVIPERTEHRYEPYPKYKGSGVEWLGEIPAHWEVKPLKRVLKVFNGSTPKSSEPEYWDGDITWVTPEDLGELASVEISETKRYITQAGYESCGTNLVPTGSLVLSTRAPIGHLAIAAVALCTNQGCRALVPRPNIRSRFSYYVLYASRQELVSLGQGSTFMELGKPELETLIFPFPKTEEQQAIADFLDEETSRIDELIAKKQRLIDLLKEQRTALITHTVTKGLNPDAPMKDSGVKWLGQIPAHWEVKKLKYTVLSHPNAIKSGPFGSQLLMSDMNGSDVKVYNQRTVMDQDFAEGEDYISEEKYSELRAFTVYHGDILITTRGTIGCCVIVPKEATLGILHPCLMRIQPNIGRVLPNYLVILMQDSLLFQGQLQYFSNATTIEVVYTDSLKNVRIPIPSIEEQQSIVDFIDQETSRIDNLVGRTNQAIEKLQEYRPALITAAVTGKIDVRQYVT